jgi:HAD superfamily hydrolase (TIGR01484 family)
MAGVLAAFDIDDSLAPVNRAMPPGVATRLAQLQAEGVIVTLASGKPCAYLAGFARAYLDAPRTILIGENGSDIWLSGIMPTRRVLGVARPEAVAELARLRAALDAGFPSVLFFQPNAVNVTAFPARDSSVTPEALRRFAAGLDPVGVTLYEHSDSLDIVPAGIDKAVALRHVLEHLGEPAARAVAVGDGANDIPMFGLVGLSICVGDNAKCRAAADVTVATALEALDLVAAHHSRSR